MLPSVLTRARLAVAGGRRAYATSARLFEPSEPTHSQVVPPRNGLTVASFLKLVGRDCDKAADKFANWDALIGSTRRSLLATGLKPAQRRWLLAWVDKYRHGVDPYTIPPRPPKVRDAKGKPTKMKS